MPELLFSYGTLQDESVQLATFGRKLTGTRDSLVGYELSMIAINDAKVAAISGATHHRIVRSTGRNTDTVCGTAFEISAASFGVNSPISSSDNPVIAIMR